MSGSHRQGTTREIEGISQLDIVNMPSRDSWNLVLDNFACGNLEQTYEYGEAKKRAYVGSEVVRLLAFDNDRPAGLIQGLYQRRFGYGRFLEVGGPYGCSPAVLLDDGKERVIRFLLESLENTAR